MEQADLHEHLFRHEAGRMTASLTRLFGVHNLALAEDVVQDAFARALDVWRLATAQSVGLADGHGS
jgi:RNA polymerase sigma-70 factor (ECF subfamily)